MKKLLLIIILVNLFYLAVAQVIPGHAHNDYENERPLHMALENRFVSVEVDVHLINDQLYVSHDPPKTPAAGKTLKSLYLQPLMDHIEQNNGKVYPGYEGPFYVMIDFKTAAIPTYKALKSVLKKYKNHLSTIEKDTVKPGPIKVFISGNRPFNQIMHEDTIIAALDGRPADLDKGIPAELMPVISDNYNKHFSWDGQGSMPQEELTKLKELVKAVHAQDKKLRLWAAPDLSNAWKVLLENGVDLINTDKVEEFAGFIHKVHYNR